MVKEACKLADASGFPVNDNIIAKLFIYWTISIAYCYAIDMDMSVFMCSSSIDSSFGFEFKNIVPQSYWCYCDQSVDIGSNVDWILLEQF